MAVKKSKTSAKKRVAEHPNYAEVLEVLDELDIPDNERPIVLSPELDSAIVGIEHDTMRLVYDYEGIVKAFMKANKWDYETALEWTDYNTMRAIPYMGDRAPIIIRGVRSCR